MPHLELDEQQALCDIMQSRVMRSALKKLFAHSEAYYTEQARNHMNVIPETLDQQAKEQAIAKQMAAMAKAYGTMFAELEKAAE